MNDTNNIPQETINTIFIDILRGSKEAGSEIYGASKAAIIKAVDFAQEQAPIVVQEFLSWKYAQSILWILLSVIGLIILGFLIKKCISKEWMTETSWISLVGAIFGTVFFLMLLFIQTVPNVEQLIKIKVAPRVYMIEWASDQLKKP